MLNADYKDMLRALSAEKVDFLLVGAYAMAAHGYPRTTMDIDIWITPTPRNAEVVLREWEGGDSIIELGVNKSDVCGLRPIWIWAIVKCLMTTNCSVCCVISGKRIGTANELSLITNQYIYY